MGLYETLFNVLYGLTSLYITVSSFTAAGALWTSVEQREADVADKGQYGVAVSTLDAMKFGAIGMIVAMGTWISAYSMGNTVDELIGWFDDWTDPSHNDASKEGHDKDDGDQLGPDGTSLSYDFFYHAITVVYSWIVFSAIIVGSHLFSYFYLGFKPVENCDLTNVDESIYSSNTALLASIIDL